MAPKGILGQSAGSDPVGYVHPLALAVLQKNNIPTENFSSKSLQDLTHTPDIVITLCADAAACPVYFGNAIHSHWTMPDPARIQGDEDTVLAAFTHTLNTLQQRLGLFAALPFAKLKHNKEALQQTLDTIGTQQ